MVNLISSESRKQGIYVCIGVPLLFVCVLSYIKIKTEKGGELPTKMHRLRLMSCGAWAVTAVLVENDTFLTKNITQENDS